MKRVLIESPYKGNNWERIQANLKYLAACELDCISRGEAYLGLHGIYTERLDDYKEAERAFGMAAGRAWGCCAELIAVYIDHGISQGMREGISHYITLGIPIEFRALDAESWMTLPQSAQSFISTVRDLQASLKHQVSEQLELAQL